MINTFPDVYLLLFTTIYVYLTWNTCTYQTNFYEINFCISTKVHGAIFSSALKPDVVLFSLFSRQRSTPPQQNS